MCAKSIIDQVADKRKTDREDQEARDAFRVKLDAWKKQGFVIAGLEAMIDDASISELDTAFSDFEESLREINTLRTNLRALDIRTLESDFSTIDYKLQDPGKVSEAKRDITNLKKKIDRRNTRWAKEKEEIEALRKEHELKVMEEQRLNKELDMEKQEDLRAQSELNTKLMEEERMKAQLQAQVLVEERLRNESAAELRKQEARAAKVKIRLNKSEEAKAKMEYDKSRADAAKAGRLLKAKEEERLRIEHQLKIKEEERLKAEVQAKAAAEKRQAMEMEALKIAERKEQVRLEMEQKEQVRKVEEAKIKAEEEMRKAEEDKLRLLELENKAKEEEDAKKLAEEEKEIAEHGIQAPDNIEGWKDIFKDWDNEDNWPLVKKIDLLSDNDIVKKMVWIVNDEDVRNNLTKFIMKWNKGNKFYRWYNENKRIVDVIRTYPGGLFTICQIFKHDHVIMYQDSIRYWQPLLKIYDANRKLYDLPEIIQSTEELDGDPVYKYSVG